MAGGSVLQLKQHRASEAEENPAHHWWCPRPTQSLYLLE